ncbi:MAG: YkgJ family cysteine cluster protein [Candidatus Omnitrophica bacterium]|nr:YkgJ family cysteine cluster protein [Candidatus Omnitrophota bacterium]
MGLIAQCIPQGYCHTCTGCCRFAAADSCWVPRLLEEETKEFAGLRVVQDSPAAQFRCEFLDPGANACRVYDRRPFECQLYPFVLCRRGTRTFVCADPACVFVRENKHRPEFQAFARQLLRHLSTPSLLDLIRRNPHLVQEYDGVEAIGEIEL